MRHVVVSAIPVDLNSLGCSNLQRTVHHVLDATFLVSEHMGNLSISNLADIRGLPATFSKKDGLIELHVESFFLCSWHTGLHCSIDRS
mmetsp:Transcript_5969/g.13154  ORF Transcript_5969/g.13154 Transcript_5969/m.13154 type:complete len:88 (-) Transcript_5969:32-295(-)